MHVLDATAVLVLCSAITFTCHYQTFIIKHFPKVDWLIKSLKYETIFRNWLVKIGSTSWSVQVLYSHYKGVWVVIEKMWKKYIRHTSHFTTVNETLQHNHFVCMTRLEYHCYLFATKFKNTTKKNMYNLQQNQQHFHWNTKINKKNNWLFF